MQLDTLLIPALGEGLCEVILRERLCEPGTWVSRDAPLYTIETDKAAIDVECPRDGQLIEWLAEPGQTLAPGDPVARFAPAGPSGHGEPSAGGPARFSPGSEPAMGISPAEAVKVPPRVRAQARALGLDDEEIRQIPATGPKLSAGDVEDYARNRAAAPRTGIAASGSGVHESARNYRDLPLGAPQQRLNARMAQSAGQVIPATIRHAYDPEATRSAALGAGADPWRELEWIGYCTAQTANRYPILRSTSLDTGKRREHDHVHLGIAVARGDGELATARIDNADRLAPESFVQAMRGAIRRAMDDGDQAWDGMQLVISHMPGLGIVDATPVLVAPAVAVLFVGEALTLGGQQTALLSLTFDHRVVDGLSAARFLHELAERLQAPMADAQPPGLAHGRPAQPISPGDFGDRDAMAQQIRLRVAEALGTDPETVRMTTPLRELGLTSLDSTLLAGRLATDLGMELPVTLVWDHPSCADITDHLMGLREAPPPTHSLDDALTLVAGLSEEEALAMLDAMAAGQGK